MSYMLGTLGEPLATQGGDNAAVETISRKDLDFAWLAGVIEGEGCFSVCWWKQTNPKCRDNHGLRPSVAIHNTHPLLIKRATEILSQYGIYFSYSLTGKRKADRADERTCMGVIVMGKGRLLKFLPLIIPHLYSKRRQAELMLDLVTYRESLAIHGRESKGRFANMDLRKDARIQWFYEEIRREKKDYPSVATFSRKANTVFMVSSTTTRSPAERAEDIVCSAWRHADLGGNDQGQPNKAA